MARIHNFNAGPAALPLPVLERAQGEFLDYEGTGMSIMEHSHRGATYDAVHNEAIERLKGLLGLGDDHQVLFLQGGASLQFAMLPMNYLGEGRSADYIVTGSWSKKALGEARVVASARSACDVHVDGVASRIPKQEELDLSADAAYCHITSNNTIFGTQYHAWPDTPGVPLVADMSSDFLWRKHDLSGFGMVYAGAQKNVGPSGLCIVVVRKDFLAQAREDGVPNILRYATHATSNSLFHTPNSFAVYMVRNVLAWLEGEGGLEAIEKRNRAQAAAVYEVIDDDPDFFRARADRESRSMMNVTFNLPSPELEKAMVAAGAEAGLAGLKGHRSVGGLRASIYNATPDAAIEALVAFMKSFRKSH